MVGIALVALLLVHPPQQFVDGGENPLAGKQFGMSHLVHQNAFHLHHFSPVIEHRCPGHGHHAAEQCVAGRHPVEQAVGLVNKGEGFLWLVHLQLEFRHGAQGLDVHAPVGAVACDRLLVELEFLVFALGQEGFKEIDAVEWKPDLAVGFLGLL